MHQSSSTEDLILLLKAEKEAILQMNFTRNQSNKQTQLTRNIDEYLRQIDYDMWVQIIKSLLEMSQLNWICAVLYLAFFVCYKLWLNYTKLFFQW